MKNTKCSICGKAIKGEAKMVRMNTAFEPIADLSREDDMGWFPVGPGCAQRIEKTLGAKLQRWQV